jgi:dCTP deaminase
VSCKKFAALHPGSPNQDTFVSLSLRADERGILPDRLIAALVKTGVVIPAGALDDDQIQPASVDLRLGEIAYRVRASFLPGPDSTVGERIDKLKLHEIPLGDGAVLETGCVYIVPLMESLSLPPDIAASANPKSSTGRLDVFTRVIADQTRGFDRVNAGYHGPLYAEISPRTFPVLVREGPRLSQLRFRRGNAVLTDDALAALHRRERLVDSDAPDLSEGVPVGVDLVGFGPDKFIGYRAKRHTGVIEAPAGGAPARCWRCGPTRCRSLSNTVRSSAAWSTNTCWRAPTRSMAAASGRITRPRA